MYDVIDLFAGTGGIRSTFHDSYAGSIEEARLNSLIKECFQNVAFLFLPGHIITGGVKKTIVLLMMDH